MSYYIPHANQHRWDPIRAARMSVFPLRAGEPLACLPIRHIDLDDSDFRRRLEKVRQTFSSTGRPVCQDSLGGKCGTCVLRDGAA